MANDNNTTTKFKVDISELKKEFTEAKRQIQLVNSEFKAATGGMDDWTKSADGLSAKLKQLDGTLEAQKKQLESLEKQYALVVKEQGADSKGAEDLMIKINNQKAAIGNTEKQIRNYNTQLENLGTDTTEATKDTEKLSDGFTVMKGVMADLVSAGIKALIQGLKDVAKYAKEAYTEVDKGYDNLIKATGATGESAAALETSYKNVAKNVKGDMSAIGSAVGEVNTRFGYTEGELEKASEAFLKFSNVTGMDATEAVKKVSRAMENAGIDADEYQAVLDQLTVAGQASGISVDKLAETLTKNGTAMRALGFDTEESIAILAKWEKEGVNTETALAGMKTAFKNWADGGKDAKREYERVIRTIRLTSDSTEAAQIAIDAFGKKAGPEMAELIQQGKLSYDDFLSVIEGSAGTVESTYEQTQDAFDKIQLAAQGLKVDVATAFKDMLSEYGPEIDAVIENVKQGISEALQMFMTEILPAIKDGISWIIENLPIIEALVAAIGAAFVAWKVVGLITAITTALEGMTLAEVALAAKQAILNAVMAANPIGLVVTAIAALVAAFIVLWNKSDKFREFWIDLWDSIQETVGDAIDWISNLWVNLADGAKNAWQAIKDTFGSIADWFKDKFSKAWQAVKDIFSTGGKIFDGIKEGIVDAFKTVVNGIIRGINKVIAIPFKAINKVLDKIHDIEIAGITPFDWVSTFDVPKIPELARGGVLKRGQVGLLEGNGAEAVVPLDKNDAWLDEIARRLAGKMSPQGGNIGGTAQSVTNNFYQTNTSPKALSRLDIYRQSKNLLSMKG